LRFLIPKFWGEKRLLPTLPKPNFATQCNQSVGEYNRFAAQYNQSANLYNKSPVLYNTYKTAFTEKEPRQPANLELLLAVKVLQLLPMHKRHKSNANRNNRKQCTSNK
jgi:hypothetical protein